jgi:ABC-type Fe3+/spermidine/putrescine transport system ATPase subunit
MALLEVRDIHLSYVDTPVLHGVSFDMEVGEIVCLLGPSGSGKTSLMRVVAGLERPDEGQVIFDDRPIDTVPVHERGFGLMFQEFALFPHKNVYENVVFGLRMMDWAQPRAEARVQEVLELVGLSGFEGRDVTELSGGERQRVALARSLAPRPRLLMLDEPLGALDRLLRDRLMDELRLILKGVGMTTLYVTHDQEEAFAIADRVLIMRGGDIVQRGTPEEVYRCPAAPFVARFLGLTNLIPGRVVDTRPLVIETPLGRLHATADGAEELGFIEGRVIVLAHPEAAQVVPSGVYADNLVEARLVDRSFRGTRYQIEVEPQAGPTLHFELSSDVKLPPAGAIVHLALQPEGLSLMPYQEDDADLRLPRAEARGGGRPVDAERAVTP